MLPPLMASRTLSCEHLPRDLLPAETTGGQGTSILQHRCNIVLVLKLIINVSNKGVKRGAGGGGAAALDQKEE